MIYPEQNTHQDPLAELRNQATDAVLSAVIDDTDELLTVGHYYSYAERSGLWQDYASEYSHIRRVELVASLEPEAKLQHPAQGDIRSMVGGMVLGIIGREIDLRTTAYSQVVPADTVPDIQLCDIDKQGIRGRFANSWQQLDSNAKYSPNALGQVSREILFANALFRLMRERERLAEALDPPEDPTMSGRHLVAGSGLRSL